MNYTPRTLRIVLIVILAAVFALFILVLIFAKEHIGELVSLLAGLVGGYGLRGGLNDLVKKTPTFHVDSNEPSLPKPR